MKKYFLVLFFALFSVSGLCQEIKISSRALPAAVLQSFKGAYPNAKIGSASKETDKGKTVYEIQTKDSVAKRTISYSADGTLIETEEQITVDRLPEAVTNAISKQYTKGKILKIELAVKDSKTEYEVLIRDKKKKIEVVFSQDGSVVHTQ